MSQASLRNSLSSVGFNPAEAESFLKDLLPAQGVFPGFWNQSSLLGALFLNKAFGFREDLRDCFGAKYYLFCVCFRVFWKESLDQDYTSLIVLAVVRFFEFVQKHWHFCE